MHLSAATLVLGTFAAILGATTFIFAGQNLGQISREVGFREQLTRTRIVIFITLLLGVFFLWMTLFMLIFCIGFILPHQVISNWLGDMPIDSAQLVRYAAFMAILGVLAGAMGGNLEEENEIKADLFYDEET